MSRRQAFTLLEMLIVIGIVVALIAILLPASNSIREMAHRTQCMSNMHQVTVAYIQYARENQDQFLPPDSLEGQAGLASSTDQRQVIPGLYRYAQNAGVFHCPSDPRDGALSYSINDYLGGTWASYPRHATRITAVGDTSKIFALIEEINLTPKKPGNNGGFVVEPSPSPVWTDFPGMVHGHGTCLTFLDGHAEYWTWSDSRTWNLSGLFPKTPANPDLIQLQGVEGLDATSP